MTVFLYIYTNSLWTRLASGEDNDGEKEEAMEAAENGKSDSSVILDVLNPALNIVGNRKAMLTLHIDLLD